MYYRLNDNVALRGWRLVPRAYYIYGVREAKGLDEEEFDLLLRCDGRHDLPPSPLLSSLEERALIRSCGRGEGLTQWQEYRFCDNRYFPHLNWAITGKCNFNCRHCFMAADNAPMMEEFSWEECMALLDQAEACGIQTVTLTGGEPMLHPRFMDLLGEIARRRMWLEKLHTNGSFVTGETLDQIRALDLDPIINISFDCIGHHDWMRGCEGAEETARNAIALCAEKGFRTRAQTCIHRDNVDALFDTAALLDRLGAEEIRVIRTSESPRWAENGGELCLTIPEYYDALLELISRALDAGLKLRLNLWQFATCHLRDGWYGAAPVLGGRRQYRASIPACRAVRGNVYLSHTGELVPCNRMAGILAHRGIRMGSVKEAPLQELLRSGAYLDTVCTTVQAVSDSNGDCRSCQYWTACQGGCRAIALALTGEYLRRDPSKCVFFKGGYLRKLDRAVSGRLRCLDDLALEGMDRAGEADFQFPAHPILSKRR